MPEQITYYHDIHGLSPFCNRVDIALLETGAPYTAHGLDFYSNKPAWYSQVNPLTGKIPAITYGGPNVHPTEPSPLSFKLTESLVILEFLADLFPESNLLPPVSNPMARARVRLFVEVARELEAPIFELSYGNVKMVEKIIKGLEKIQALLPDPDVADGGEYATGREFTNADCAIVPLLVILELIARTDLGRFGPETGKKIQEALAADRFERLRRYKKAVWERESVKKVADLDRLESIWKKRFGN